MKHHRRRRHKSRGNKHQPSLSLSPLPLPEVAVGDTAVRAPLPLPPLPGTPHRNGQPLLLSTALACHPPVIVAAAGAALALLPRRGTVRDAISPLSRRVDMGSAVVAATTMGASTSCRRRGRQFDRQPPVPHVPAGDARPRPPRQTSSAATVSTAMFSSGRPARPRLRGRQLSRAVRAASSSAADPRPPQGASRAEQRIHSRRRPPPPPPPVVRRPPPPRRWRFHATSRSVVPGLRLKRRPLRHPSSSASLSAQRDDPRDRPPRPPVAARSADATASAAVPSRRLVHGGGAPANPRPSASSSVATWPRGRLLLCRVL